MVFGGGCLSLCRLESGVDALRERTPSRYRNTHEKVEVRLSVVWAANIKLLGADLVM